MGKIFLHKSLDEIVARLVADMRHFGAPKHSGCSLTQSHHSDIHAEPRQFCMQRFSLRAEICGRILTAW